MKYLLLPTILLTFSCSKEKQLETDNEVKHKTEEEHWKASRESVDKTVEEAKKSSKY